MIWVVFALMTGAVVFSVLWPLARAPRRVTRREKEIAFYEAQITEIQRDLERGLTSVGEAEGARAQAARRLLETSQPGDSGVAPARPMARRIAALAAIIIIPAVALGVYWRVGSPGLPDEPLSARLNAAPGKMDVSVMLANIEAHLAQHPEDGRGWELIAPVYLRLGRAQDAARAFSNAIRTLGDSSERESELGTALVYAGDGQVDDRAREAFEGALRLDPHALGPRFYLGLAAQQVGDKTRAAQIWTQLLAEAPPDATWAPMVRERVAALGAAAPPPNATAAALIAAMPAGQQGAAIHGMVDNLAARLAKNGGDVESWTRLVRAYSVLHETDKARKALADARQNLTSDGAALARLDALARQLGLES